MQYTAFMEIEEEGEGLFSQNIFLFDSEGHEISFLHSLS